MTRSGVNGSEDSLKPVRVVVIGDKETGKSSLIKAAVSGSFHKNVPRVLPVTSFFCNNVNVTVVDTSSRHGDKNKIVKEIKEADAIVLTFVLDRPETIESLSEFWLPLLRKLEVKVPVIAAGYKLDFTKTYDYVNIKEIMSQFKEIETCLEWSSQRINEAREVFCYAQKAVLNPLEPVYDQETQRLKPSCVAALTRIFYLSCNSTNNVLNNSDLSELQVKCFNEPLSHHKCEAVKEFVQVNFPEGVDEKELTLPGFLYLLTRFIHVGKIEKIWIVLRRFGYNNNLRIADHLIPYSSFERDLDQSVELTFYGIDFLSRIFKMLDQFDAKELSPDSMVDLFLTAPDNPWSVSPYINSVETTRTGGLSEESFLSLWSLMTLLEPAKSLEYMMYIRTRFDPALAIKVTRKKSQDLEEKQCTRRVLQCFVFGPKNSGKSTLLKSFINRRSYHDTNIESTHDRYAVKMVKSSSLIRRKTLVLREIQVEEEKLKLSEESLGSCDVAIFLFDYSDERSWKKAIRLLLKVSIMAKNSGFAFPCLFYGVKFGPFEFPNANQEYAMIADYLQIKTPQIISLNSEYIHKLFEDIVSAAENPHLNVPVVSGDESAISKSFSSSLMAVSILAVGTAVAIVGMAVYRLFTARNRAS